jgi:ABC-type glycerol-3-phosphate transport system permease component
MKMQNILSTNVTAAQVIQLMLAPAVMISACGLLLLGINNKYSLVVNRIRLLNEEKRRLKLRAGERDFNTEENIRLESIAHQLKSLVFRVKLVRNSVLCYTGAVGLFVITSMMIGFDFAWPFLQIKNYIIGSFLIGMLMVFCGIAYAFLETKRGYEIVRFEVGADE